MRIMRIMRKKIAVAFALAFSFIAFVDHPRPAKAASPIYPAATASPFPAGCGYNLTPPVLANGATGQLQCDANLRVLSVGTATAPSPIPIQATQYARTGAIGSLTTGGVAQNWASPGSITHGCFIQNRSSSVEYIRMDGAAATTASLQIAANGGYYECPATAGPTGAASILGGTTSQSWYSEVW